MERNNRNKEGKAALILIIALLLVIGISLLPISRWSGGKIKDFNLLGDIMNDSVTAAIYDNEVEVESTMVVDPELAKVQESESQDTLDGRVSEITGMMAESDSDYQNFAVVPVKPSRVGEVVVIEDYTSDNRGLSSLRSAIASGRHARIAVVGDSYIEGDIFTQDLREKLQNAYGGHGVGYVNMHSDFPGFRKSIKQGGNGWKIFTALKKAKNKYMALSEQYSTPTGTALSTYNGTASFPQAGSWSISRFLFISPDDAVVSCRTGKGEWVEHEIKGDSIVQCISVNGMTENFEVKTSATSLIGLGVWLDGTDGVSVDCMSSRGFSGITLSRINTLLCRQMSQSIPYNLIILEFGINAMSPQQKDYHIYSNRMVDVINHVRSCYPGADILLMGIGDRGEKRGGAVHSMSVAPAMIAAQRDAARRAHCLFWDTREAMGGEDAIVEWSRQGLANKDYIHLTHKGGARLADELFNALQQCLK